MRSFFLTSLFLFGTFLIVSSQITVQNIISVVGNSIETIQAIGLRVTVELIEMERNEYQKIRKKKIEEIKQDLTEPLAQLGYTLNDLEEVFPPYNRYNKNDIEKYTIDVKNEEEAKAIFKFDIKGFKPSNVVYIYPDKIAADNDALTAKAIEDAEQKAKSLASQAGKRIGKILNIDAKSSNAYKTPYNSKSSEYSFTYSLNVAFELLDK